MAGVIGTGKIGKCVVHALRGLGCNVVMFDTYHDPALVNLCKVDRNVCYVDTMDEVLK